MTKWEYKCITYSPFLSANRRPVSEMEQLREAGEDGWELVSTILLERKIDDVTVHYLKRQIPVQSGVTLC